jgi:hypothetical protein
MGFESKDRGAARRRGENHLAPVSANPERADRFQLDGNLGNLSQAEHLEGGAGLTE